MEDQIKKNVWIAWERQRRSTVLSTEFGCELFIYEVKHRFKMLRYFYASLETIKFIKKNRPEFVFGQNPSMLLAILLCIIKKRYAFKLIIDRHSNFLFNYKLNGFYYLFHALSRYTIKYADLTLVTNEKLKIEYIDQIGGIGAVLPDKIPNMIVNQSNEVDKFKFEKSVFFITSFSRDEPIREFFEAIKDIDNVYFYVSGDYTKGSYNVENKGINYELTGFTSEEVFKKTLNSVDAVMVFTKHEYTLTCGAYEGIAVGKPIIVSNTSAIREYFKHGAIYCDMSAESIKNGVIECFSRYEEIVKELEDYRIVMEMEWAKRFKQIKLRLGLEKC
ncbi:MAG: glycosyltransferase [Trichloromonadaceae bacterium]